MCQCVSVSVCVSDNSMRILNSFASRSVSYAGGDVQFLSSMSNCCLRIVRYARLCVVCCVLCCSL